MDVRLRGISGPYEGQTITLRSGRYSVGRRGDSAVRLTKDQAVSSQHALLVVQPLAVVVDDRGSRNGTFVNGARLAVPTVLDDGDQLRLGASQWRVVVRPDANGDEDEVAPAELLDPSPPFEELPPRLQILDGEHAGQVVPLPPDTLFLAGRGPDVHLVLDDPFCSRQHAAFLWRGDQVVVRDNQSRNGLLVDGQQVQALHLRGGEVVTVGRTRVRFAAPGEGLPTDVRTAVATDPATAEPSRAAERDSDVPAELERAVGQFGPYSLVREIGRGGMGRVFEARTRGHAPVALKVLRTKGLDPARADIRRRRFEREATVLQRVHHENVVSYRDAGVIAGQPYLAMELLEGPDLVAELRSGRAMPYAEIERILFQLCAAVSAVHEARIVHRDLKPANVILHGAQRTVKLTDLGIARRIEERDLEGDEEALGAPAQEGEITLEGRHPGTPFYMSPEQIRGEMLDLRSDIWALGVVLYQLVSGGRPFEGRTGQQVMGSIVAHCPQPLPDHVPGYVQSVVYRCLLKPPSWRFRSAIDLMDALHERRVEQPAPVGVDGPPHFPLTQCPFCGAGIAVGRDKCPLCRTDLNVFLEGHMLHLEMDSRFYAICGSCGKSVSTNDKNCRRCGRLFKARQTAAETLRDESLSEAELEELVHALVKLSDCPYCHAKVDVVRPQCTCCGLQLRAILAGRVALQPDGAAVDRCHCGNCHTRMLDPGVTECAQCHLNFVTGRLPDGRSWHRDGVRGRRRR
ncbi:MAG: protein kinase [Armatimonadetes bacterium]|nr:protein kinase [Armatimonadota bacterium]